MKPNYLILLFTLVLLGNYSLDAQNSNWKLIKDADEILVFSKVTHHSEYKIIRVSTRVKSSLSALVFLVKDAQNHKNWVYLCKKGEIIRSVSPWKWIYYGQSNAPWPLMDRDVVTRVQMVQDPVTKAVTITSKSFPNHIPCKVGYVRIPFVISKWYFMPRKNGFVNINLMVEIDLGGNIPKWLMRLTSVKGPYRTVHNFLAQLQRKKYQDAHLSYITEP